MAEIEEYQGIDWRGQREHVENARTAVTQQVTQESALLSQRQIMRLANFIEPSACGIYFLIFKREIVYVGQSVRIYARVYLHKAEGKKIFDRWAWIPCAPADLNFVERAYINAHQPTYNADKKVLDVHALDVSLPFGHARAVRERVDMIETFARFEALEMEKMREAINRLT